MKFLKKMTTRNEMIQNDLDLIQDYFKSNEVQKYYILNLIEIILKTNPYQICILEYLTDLQNLSKLILCFYFGNDALRDSIIQKEIFSSNFIIIGMIQLYSKDLNFEISKLNESISYILRNLNLVKRNYHRDIFQFQYLFSNQ